MTRSTIKEYMAITGQDIQDILAGECQYGPAIINRLIDRTLREKKRIDFIPELTNGQNLGMGRYELVDL